MENLKGRYVKILQPLKDENVDKLKNIDYMLITSNPGIGMQCYHTKEYGITDVQGRIRNGELELMPEGWSPNNSLIEDFCIF